MSWPSILARGLAAAADVLARLAPLLAAYLAGRNGARARSLEESLRHVQKARQIDEQVARLSEPDLHRELFGPDADRLPLAANHPTQPPGPPHPAHPAPDRGA